MSYEMSFFFNILPQVLLHRGSSKEGVFLHSPTGAFDHELFSLIWGQTVAALSFVFDKSVEETIIQKSVSGFRLVYLSRTCIVTILLLFFV